MADQFDSDEVYLVKHRLVWFEGLESKRRWEESASLPYILGKYMSMMQRKDIEKLDMISYAPKND